MREREWEGVFREKKMLDGAIIKKNGVCNITLKHKYQTRI